MNLCLYYAELGRGYLPMIKRMLQSAKEHAIAERTVLITPTPTHELIRLFDQTMITSDRAITKDNLCWARGRALARYAGQMEEPTLFVDPDIAFRAPVPFRWATTAAYIMLLWRKKIDQPINTGIVYATPGAPQFWQHYGEIVTNLPKEIHGWYCDQLAFALLTGVCRQSGNRIQVDDASVILLDAYDHCYNEEMITESAWAIHYKGPRKNEDWRERHKGELEAGKITV